MNSIRRKFLKSTTLFGATAAAFGAGLLAPGQAVAAYLTDAFAASDVSSWATLIVVSTGCSICLASASMMSECTTGLVRQQAQQLSHQMQEWFADTGGDTPPHTSLAALAAVRQHPARKKCVLLAWMALEEALTDLGE